MSSKFVRLAAVAACALVAVAAAVAISSSGAERPAPGEAAPSLLAGIPERDGILGDPAAPVTVTEYVDLQCPVCAVAAQEVLPALVRDHVRTGRVKLALRTLHFLGPDSERAARVAAGAERQNRLWPFVEAFYARQGGENSGYVTDEFLREVASAAGVDAGAALEQAGSDFAQTRLERANADAARLGISGTPTFAIARAGDETPEVVDAGSLLAALEREPRR